MHLFKILFKKLKLLKPAKKQFLKRIQNKTGSMLLPLIITASSLPLIAFLGYYNLQYKSKQIETDEFILFKETIQSVLKYTVFGVERKYCFDENWDYKLICGQLTYERSSERILLSNVELNLLEKFIEDQNKLGKHPGCTEADKTCYQEGREDCRKCLDLPERLADIKLNTFEREFNHTNLKDSKQFILADYFEKYTGDNDDGIELKNLKITITDKASIYKAQGLEKYIEIKVESKVKDRGKSKKYTVTWNLALFPRELNSFSLLLGKDIYFYDEQQSLLGDVEDGEPTCVSSPVESTKFSEIEKDKKSEYKGLTFQSPVFVNGNMHFKKDSNKFTPVHFVDKLFLGRGNLLYNREEAFVPKKAGSLFDYKEFNVGGFYKGILLEDSDKGLEVFSGQAPCDDNRAAMIGCRAQADGDEELEYSINYTLENVSKVSLGESHTCAIQAGKLYCWGINNFKQLGRGSSDIGDPKKPKLVAAGTEDTNPFTNENVEQVSVSSYHTWRNPSR